MSEKKMDLLMRVRAEVNQAISGLKSVENSLNKTWSAASGMGSAAVAPIRYAAGAVTALGAAFAAVETKALMSAAADQKLEMRLETLYGSADKAKKKFAELEGMTLNSVYTSDELVEATIVMEQYGLAGATNLRAVGGAAYAAGVGIQELALQMAALQARGLKRFGIEMDTKGEATTFQYRDKMGKIVRIVAQGADDARKALLGIFQAKFGGNIGARGLSGLVAAFRNTVDQAFGNFGGGLLPFAEKFVERLRSGLAGLIEDGSLAKWGEKTAEAIVKAFDYASVIAKQAQEIFSGLNAGGAEAWGKALKIVFSAAAETLVVSIVTYLRAASSVFIGIGKIIAGAFLEPILQLPGMNLARASLAASNAKKMTVSEMVAGGVPKDLALRVSMASGMDEKQRAELSGDFLKWSKANPEAAAKLAAGNSADIMRSGIQEFTTQLPALATELAGALSEIWRQATDKLQETAGVTGAPTIAERMKGYESGRYFADIAPSVAAAKAAMPAPYAARYIADTSAFTGEINYRSPKGKTFGWAGALDESRPLTGIFINGITVRANSVRQFRDAILQEGTRPRAAIGGL